MKVIYSTEKLTCIYVHILIIPKVFIEIVLVGNDKNHGPRTGQPQQGCKEPGEEKEQTLVCDELIWSLVLSLYVIFDCLHYIVYKDFLRGADEKIPKISFQDRSNWWTARTRSTCSRSLVRILGSKDCSCSERPQSKGLVS